MKKSGNPCLSCPDTGCGNHAHCDRYMKFYNECRANDKTRIRESIAREYTVDAVLDVKQNGSKSNMKRYRPKGWW